MSAPNRNTAWARAFVDELARADVRAACVAPGSRSTPLVLALARDDRLRTYVHLDERSAAFFALGIGKATGRPVAVVTTSGTAVANLLPAVVEADQSETPLLLLTGDRPRRLRGTDANQTIDQVEIFGSRVRWSADVPAPEIGDEALRHLRGLAVRAVAASTAAPPGPVHVNFPFDKPLEPTPVPGDVPPGLEDEAPLAARGRPDAAPFTRVTRSIAAPSSGSVDRLAELLSGETRVLLVAGPTRSPSEAGGAVRELAEATGWPLLADALSGARFGPGARQVALPAYDHLVRVEELWTELRPDVVLRVGGSPTSRPLSRFLASVPDALHVVVDDGRRWKDPTAVASEHVVAPPNAFCRALGERVEARPRPEWSQAWWSAARRTARVLDRHLTDDPFEGTVLAGLAETLPPGATLFVGNSMPVRDLDAFAAPRDAPLRVLGNRGASGIDGLVSTALGIAAGIGGTVVAVLGDLSLYHDMNGLFAARRHGLDVLFVVINNDGGGIFHFLPVREFEPGFTEFFATPHGLDFAGVAELYGLGFRRLGDPASLRRELESDGAGPGERGARIVEVPSDRERNRRRHEEVEAAVREALTA